MKHRYSSVDGQWERLQGLSLPGNARHVGHPAKDTRLLVESERVKKGRYPGDKKAGKHRSKPRRLADQSSYAL